MHKTPARKKYGRNHHAWNAAVLKNLQKNAKQIIAKSIDNARDRSGAVQDYVSERPAKAVGVSLILGVCGGLLISYFIQQKR